MAKKWKDGHKEFLAQKYADRIAGISEANNVDLGVALDMFIANAQVGAGYAGGGECTTEQWAEIIADVNGGLEDC